MITYLLDNDTVVRIESHKDIGDMVHAQIYDSNSALVDVKGRVVDILEDYEDWHKAARELMFDNVESNGHYFNCHF